LIGIDEWRAVPVAYHRMQLQKFGDLKLFECPTSFITSRTWQIIALVNESTNSEGDILHLPFPGTLLEQPIWYREARRMVQAERHSEWNRELQTERAKRRADKER
jgi:hypothetical protein